MGLQPCACSELIRRDDGFLGWIVTHDHSRATTEILAGVAIAAHGSWEVGPLATQRPIAPARPADWLAFKAHFRDTGLPIGLMPLLSFADGYGGMVHCDGGRASLSCCIRRWRLERLAREHGQSAGEAVLGHILDSCPVLRPILDDATLDGPWLSAGPIQPGLRPCYRSGVFALGNAAGEAHPVVAEGISMAHAVRLAAGELVDSPSRRIEPAEGPRPNRPGVHVGLAWGVRSANPGRSGSRPVGPAAGPRSGYVAIAAGCTEPADLRGAAMRQSPIGRLARPHANIPRMPDMSFRIAGLGTAVPAHTMTQPEAIELAQQVICRTEQQSRLLSVLYRKAGVEQRHTALPHRIALEWLPPVSDSPAAERGVTLGPTTAERMRFFAEHAPPLAQQAASRALAEAGLEADQITHLVTVSCTGFDAPGVDAALLTGLALRPTTQRIQVGFMGCHGAINGLRVAQALAAADPTANVLLVCRRTVQPALPVPVGPGTDHRQRAVFGRRCGCRGMRILPTRQLECRRHRLVPVAGQPGRDELADRRSRL